LAEKQPDGYLVETAAVWMANALPVPPERAPGMLPRLLRQGMLLKPPGRQVEQSTPEPLVLAYPEADPE
jgi:hypothetical protein